MRKKWIFLLVFVVMMAAWGSVTSFATETSSNYLTLTEEDLGQRSLLGSPIKDRVDLFGRVLEFKTRVSNSIELGQQPLPESLRVDSKKHADLIEAALKRDINVTETDLPLEAPIYWMGYESKRGGEQVIRDRIWRGKNPLPGFLIIIQDDGKEFAYFVPKSCGNLSLVGKRVLEPPKAELPPPSPPAEEKVRIVEKVIVREVPVEKVVQVPVEKIVEVPVQVPGPTVPGPTQVVYVPQQTEQQIPWWALLPPPPMIIGVGGGFGFEGYSGGGCGGGYSGRQDYFGGNGNGNWGRGRGNRGGQGVNVINNISLDNSSYSSSRATGGNARVDFNSNINNRQSLNNRQSFNNRRQQQQCPTGQTTCPTDTPNSAPAPRTASDLSATSGNISGNGNQTPAQAAQRSTSTTRRNSRSATRYNGTQSTQMQSAMRSGRQAYSGANSSGRSQSYGGRSSVSGGRSFSGGNRMAGSYGGGGGRGGGGRGRR